MRPPGSASPQGRLSPGTRKGSAYDHALIEENLDGLLLLLEVQDPCFLLLAQDLEEIRETEFLQGPVNPPSFPFLRPSKMGLPSEKRICFIRYWTRP